jgi:hypothetical protein
MGLRADCHGAVVRVFVRYPASIIILFNLPGLVMRKNQAALVQH